MGTKLMDNGLFLGCRLLFWVMARLGLMLGLCGGIGLGLGWVSKWLHRFMGKFRN